MHMVKGMNDKFLCQLHSSLDQSEHISWQFCFSQNSFKRWAQVTHKGKGRRLSIYD